MQSYVTLEPQVTEPCGRQSVSRKGAGLSRRPGGDGDKTEQDLIRGDNSNEIEPDCRVIIIEGKGTLCIIVLE